MRLKAFHHIIAREIERSDIFKDNADRNMAELSRRLNLSLLGVSLSVKRGEKIV